MVIISILVWDSPRYVENLLKSLFSDHAISRSPYEVYVVDQGSEQETKDVLARYKEHIHLIELEKNIGFGEGHNLVYKKAQAGPAFDYFCVVNSDIKFTQDNWLDSMMRDLCSDD